jgi:hypothetical protein
MYAEMKILIAVPWKPIHNKIMKIKTIIHTDTTAAVIDAIIAESIDDPAGTVAINALNRCTEIFQGTATISEVKQFFLNRYTFMALPNAGKFLC